MTKQKNLFVLFLKKQERKLPSILIRKVEVGIMDKDLFKKLNDDVWELRTLYDGMCYRLLAFWDKEHNSLIIVTHGFVKKTWKVPQKELDKVEAFKKQYYSNE